MQVTDTLLNTQQPWSSRRNRGKRGHGKGWHFGGKLEMCMRVMSQAYGHIIVNSHRATGVMQKGKMAFFKSDMGFVYGVSIKPEVPEETGTRPQ